MDFDKGVKIRNLCGDVWFFSMDEIKNVKIHQQAIQTDSVYQVQPSYLSQPKPNQSTPPPPVYNYKSKYPNGTAVGNSRHASNQPYVYNGRSKFDADMSFSMMIGRGDWGLRVNSDVKLGVIWNFKPQLSFSAGTGLQWVEGFSFPFYFTTRYYLKDEARTPYFYGTASANNFTSSWTRRTGSHYEIGLGILNQDNARSKTYVQAFYRYSLINSNGGWNSFWTSTRYINRFGLTIGWQI